MEKEYKGFYKKKDGFWQYAPNAVYLPDGSILNEENKESKGGWMWKDEPPEGYLEQIKN